MNSLFGHLRLRARLVLTVLVTTAFAIAIGTYVAIRFFEDHLVATTERASRDDADELRVVLEHEMMEPDHSAIQRLVDQIGSASGVRWVGVVDAHGTIQVSSHHPKHLDRFAEGSEERELLRRWEGSPDAASLAEVRPGCSVLRIMMPIVNEQRCWQCHGSHHTLNGMVIIDRSLEPVRAAAAAGARRLTMGGIVALALVLVALGLVIERSVLLRLDRLRRAAHNLGSGNLAARAEDDGSDELGDVAREFNGMATRLEGAIVGLAAQRQRLDELVNGIADGVVLLDLQGRVLTMNRAFAGRMGGDRPLPGTTYRELLGAAGVDPEGGELPAERALASGKLEKEVVNVAGGERVEELYAQPLLGPDGRTAAVIEVWRDITDRKTLEASVEQSERLASMGVLASSVAHEVGNPLAAIITAVDGLLTRAASGEAASPDELREYLEIVRNQVFRCQGVTERLLGFARVPSGEDAVIDVAAAVREVLTLVGPQARAQYVAFELHGPERALAAAPDMLVEQVFLNLVLNALKAMPSGGKLRVEVGAEEDRVAVAFADTGPGIPEHLRKHLFQPFRRARRDRSGTGLGLFISHALITRAGGTLEVATRPGEGTRFVVRLRRAPELPVRAADDRTQGALA